MLIRINEELWDEIRKSMCIYFECSDENNNQFPKCKMYGHRNCPLTSGKELLAKSIVECVLRQIITWE